MLDLSNLSSSELRKLYEQIIEWDKTGVLKEGTVRTMVGHEANRNFGNTYMSAMINTRNLILNEIARRWYNNNKSIFKGELNKQF